MSAREWAPGDVAHLTFEDQTTATGVRNAKNDGWEHAGEWGGGAAYDRIGCTVARRLAVIDPEDREQVERLADALVHARKGHRYGNAYPGEIDEMQAALREFADPTPPRPEEPQGLGAVVEDAEGRTWVRVHEYPVAWTSGFIRARRTYGDIDVVRVLSSGVEPLAEWERELLDGDLS